MQAVCPLTCAQGRRATVQPVQHASGSSESWGEIIERFERKMDERELCAASSAHQAAARGDVASLRLLQVSALTAADTNKGYTPAHLAAQHGHATT